jgi:hypothetical protein
MNNEEIKVDEGDEVSPKVFVSTTSSGEIVSPFIPPYMDFYIVIKDFSPVSEEWVFFFLDFCFS